LGGSHKVKGGRRIVLYLSLFGHLSLARCDGGARSQGVDVTGRPGCLLAYLALAKGRFFSRTDLIAALWSDQGEPASLGTFNTTLWRLRKTLERPPLEQSDIVTSDRRGAVGLVTDAQLQLDVDEFVRLVGPSLDRPMEQLTPSDVADLRRGVALYRDDILAGFTDDWALREREMHRRTMLNALARLMQVSVLAADYPGAIRYAQDILDRDPLREDIHRELMRLFLVSGQRAMALRQFEQCRTALRKELAIRPMSETLAVYQQIANTAVGVEDVAPAADSPRGNAVRESARDLIANARRYLAEADAHLQRSLPLFDEPVPGLGR